MPKRSKKGLQGQEILWTQFNDISFFIEDSYQENFYFHVLKKLFPAVKFSRIFPLGGKIPVIKRARKSAGNKKKVFIIDKDFDDILNKKEALPNLFYLDRYSIENYLLEPKAIFELIREESPKIKHSEIKRAFNFNRFLADAQSIFSVLGSNFLLIAKYHLGISYLTIDIGRDCDLAASPKCIRLASVSNYYNEVENALKTKRPRMKYAKQQQVAKKFFTIGKILKNMPGKYLLNLLKLVLRRAVNFGQCKIESFTYRLLKNCELTSLTPLKAAIGLFIA